MYRSMQLRTAHSVLVLVLVSSGVLRAQSQSPASAARSDTALATKAPNRDDQQQAMKEDIQKMQVILNQMRTNLAFVGSTTTPLNHQFELEIGMWQLLIDQMERRVGQPARNDKRAAPPGSLP